VAEVVRGSTRIVVADDDVLMREGVAGLLERGGYEVVGQAGDGSELMRLVREHRPDLAVVDIRMPPAHRTEGLDAARAAGDPLEELTPREREVLQLMAEGRSNAGIGRRLCITEGTVERHIHNIMMKLHLPESDDDHRRVLAATKFLDARQTGLSRS
jgi:DNA-binding NarL/FixJ family response regulator